MPDVVGIIPARLGSTRLPRKMLAEINGKCVIQHTYENARRAGILDDLFVATDSEEILRIVEAFGGKAVMTSPDCRCGTERVAEATAGLDCDILVNIQGDEAFLPHELISLVVETLRKDAEAVMGTVARRIADPAEYEDRNVVKVVLDSRKRALYFSRAAIPHSKTGKMLPDIPYFHHIGLYSYRREFVLRYSSLPESALERAESLEQLRVLENGYPIAVGITDMRTIKIDTEDDLKKAEKGVSQDG